MFKIETDKMEIAHEFLTSNLAEELTIIPSHIPGEGGGLRDVQPPGAPGKLLYRRPRA